MKFSDQTWIHAYSPACVLRITGPDAATFLQGQFTNDLSTVSMGKSAYGLWLDRKGRVLGDSHVIRPAAGDGFWVVSVASGGDAIARHLGAHLIADEVEVADESGRWRGLALVGEGTGAWLAQGERPGHFFPGRRALAENWEWVFPEAGPAHAGPAAPAGRAAGPDEIELLRSTAGIPALPADIGPGDLPSEGGLEADAISYSKGCYIGQEVMARIKALGRVRRALVRVRGPGPAPAVPAALWRGARREGELRSVAGDAGGFAGLALVSV